MVCGDRWRQYKNTGEIGDAANASSVIVSTFPSSEARVILLKCTARLLQTENWSERILPKLQEMCAFDSVTY